MNNRSLQGQYAGFVSRAVGLAIDVAISTGSVAVVGWFLVTILQLFGIDAMNCPAGLQGAWWLSVCRLASLVIIAFSALFFPTYLIVFWTLTGETPGMRIMGVRVVRADGQRVNLWTAIKRWFGYMICALTLGLGFLWVLLDNQRQGLHDIIAGTAVIYSWEARQREKLINRMQRDALRAKTTAQVARDFGADAWAGKDYHVVVLSSSNAAQLQQICDQLITWYKNNPSQVLVAVTLNKDEHGKLTMAEVAEILPPSSVVLTSNPSIPRLGEVRDEVYHVMNELPDDRSALVAVIDRPLVSEMVQVASDAEVTVYKGGWAKPKTTVPVPGESIAEPAQTTAIGAPAGEPATIFSAPGTMTAIAPASFAGTVEPAVETTELYDGTI